MLQEGCIKKALEPRAFFTVKYMLYSHQEKYIQIMIRFLGTRALLVQETRFSIPNSLIRMSKQNIDRAGELGGGLKNFW